MKLPLFFLGGLLALTGCTSHAVRQADDERALSRTDGVQQNPPTKAAPAPYIVCERSGCLKPTPIY